MKDQESRVITYSTRLGCSLNLAKEKHVNSKGALESIATKPSIYKKCAFLMKITKLNSY